MKKNGLFSRVALLVFSAVLMAGVFSGCEGSASQAVLKVDGVSVRRDEFMLHLFYTKYEFFNEVSSGNLDITKIYQLDLDTLDQPLSGEVTLRQYLKEMTVSSAKMTATAKKIAKEENISLTKDDKASVKSFRDSFIESLGGAKEYNSFLSQVRTNDAAFKRYWQDYMLMNKLISLFAEGGKYAMTEAEHVEMMQDYAEQYITAKHILLPTINLSSGAELSEETKAEKLQKAEEALGKIRNGTSFESVQADYSEDSTVDGMTFTKGEFMPEFEEAAYGLEIGEVSGIVETSYGYHIIKRVELTTTDDSLLTHYQAAVTEKYYGFLSERVNSAKVVESKSFANLIIQ